MGVLDADEAELICAAQIADFLSLPARVLAPPWMRHMGWAGELVEDRWRGRCSVCARDARSACAERVKARASVAARDARRRRRAAEASAPCAVRRPGEGAAGDGAREQPTRPSL